MLGKIDSLFGRLGEYSRDFSWLVFRLLGASMFMTHGYAKLFSEDAVPITGAGMTTIRIGELINFAMPMEINAFFIAGVIEFFGGLLIFIGLWTHLAAFAALMMMIMAYLTAHLAWYPTLNGGELAAMYLISMLIIFSAGPGTVSVDNWLAERRQEKQQKKMDKLK